MGSIAGGLVASAWGYPAALAAGAGAVAVGLAILTVTLRRRRGGAAFGHTVAQQGGQGRIAASS